MQIPAVILGANFYTPLGAIRTLGRHGVPVYALDYHFPSAYGIYSRYVTKRLRCPNINEDEAALVRYLVELGESFKEKPVLMPSADNYALMISRHASTLADYYIFPEMPEGLLENIVDKKGLSILADELGLHGPLTFIADAEADLEHIADSIPYPCIVKPALSHKFVKIFRQKCLHAHDSDELLIALNRARAENLEVMVQEIIPGFDDHMYVFDAYIDSSGEITHTFCGQKLRQFPINFGSSTLTRQMYDPELERRGIEYFQKLGYRGYGEIEFKKDPRTGEYCLIEINARLSSLNALFDKCGVEFTYIMYMDLIGQPLQPYFLREEKGWVFWHLYEDLLSTKAYLATGQLTPGEIIKPWLAHRKAHAIWAADDIKPLFAFSRVILGKAFSKLGRMVRKKGDQG